MITKAIIPVAGIGSRTLPASKSIPKEMFPVVDKPVIHYIVKEVVDSGIKEIIFVTSSTKKAIEDYFDFNFELEYRLDKKGKNNLKEQVKEMVSWANYYFIRQPEPLGDGDAVLRAAALLAPGEACAVLWGDDIIVSQEPALKQMIAVYEQYHAPIVAVEQIPGPAIERYGVIDGQEIAPQVFKLSQIVEKPKLADAPSDLGIVGRYIVTSEVIAALRKQKPAANGEILFANGLRDAMPETAVYGYKFTGDRYDCGNKLGWLKANIALGRQDPEIGEEVRKFLISNF